MSPETPEPIDPWQPILTGNLAREACAAVRAISDALYPEPAPRPGIASGEAGLALFWAYLARAGGGREHEETALRFVERSIDAVADQWLPANLYGGYPGIAWLVEHLQGTLLSAEDGEDPNEEIEESLYEHLAGVPCEGEYDLILGLTGLGVFALERLPRPRAADCLERIVLHLEAASEERPEGIAWRTPRERQWAELRDLLPEGGYNLGVGHGAPGVVALLAGACAAGVAAERARPLLDGAVAWILAQRLEDRSRSVFPDVVGPGCPPRPARLAWCYGDAGIAAVLHAAGRAVGEPAWQREALAIAVEAAARPLIAARVGDACLCHGSAGLGHLFNRLYQRSGDLRLRDAAVLWFRHALAQRQDGAGVAGYLYQAHDEEGGGRRPVPERGFLTGAAGIGLALLAAVAPVEPAWDRLLLASVRA
jgi:lantibiotic modifying enzyme